MISSVSAIQNGLVILIPGALPPDTLFCSHGAISWKSRRQPTVALSSTEAEYIAITDASKEAILLRHLFEIQAGKQPQCIVVDNSSAIELAKRPQHYDRTKHTDIQHHSIREAVDSKLAIFPGDTLFPFIHSSSPIGFLHGEGF